MPFHASCAARLGPSGYDAVLILGPPGAGKSDFLLRLIHAGWTLVADDQVLVDALIASAPPALAGIIELRGLGLFRLPFIASAELRLVVQLGVQPERLPEPERHPALDLPLITIDPAQISAVERVALSLEAACGRVNQIAGAFAA